MTADDLLAAYLETGALDLEAFDALGGPDQARVRASIPDLDRARATLGDPDAWAEPAPDLEQRVLASIGSADRPSPQGGDEGMAGEPADAPAPASVVSLDDARVKRSRIIAIGAALVAAAAIAVAIVAFADRGSVANDLATSGTEFALQGTDLLPDASGQVRLQDTSSGMRVYLDARGLPRRDNGEFYEAWAKTDKGLVPIGTFHTGTDVTLWSGVSMADVRAITVSLEQNDGNQETSGQRVMIAQVR